MADINLTFGADDLKKVSEEITKAAKQFEAAMKKVGAVTDNDVASVKRLAVERKKLDNQMRKEVLTAQRIAAQQDKYNAKINESKGIIGGLAQKSRELQSALKAATNPKDIQNINRELKKTREAMAKAKGTTASWGKALGSFQFKFNALGNIAANVLSKITTQLTQAAKEALKLSREFDGVRNAFNKLPNSTRLLRDLRQATRGTVTDLQLMKNAVSASNFRLPLEQLAKYFEFASVRAYQTGQSVDYLTESIVLGLSRESVKIIDNLGISMLDIRKEMEQTGDMATAVGNIIDRDMGGLGDGFDNAKVKADQLQAALTNLQIAWGGFITESGAGGYLIGFLTDAIIQLDNLDIAFKRINKKSSEEAERTFDVFQQLSNKQGKAIQGITKEYLDASTDKIAADREEIISSLKKSKQANLNQKEAVELYTVLLLRANEREKVEINSDENITKVKKENIRLLKEELDFWEKARDEASLSEIGSINNEIDAIKEKIKVYEEAGKASAVRLPLPDIKEIKDLEAEWRKLFTGLGEGVDLGDDFWDEWFKGYDNIAKDALESDKEFLKARGELYDEELENQKEREKKELIAFKEKEERKRAILTASVQAAAEIGSAFVQIRIAQLDAELNAEGLSSEQLKAIRKKQAEERQSIAVKESLINTAVGIGLAFAQYGWPAGIIPAALTLAAGTAQVAVIKSQQFAKGGPIDGEPHSRGGVPIEAEGGEYVINKKSTGKYKNLIEAINQDDQVRIMDAMSRDKKITINQVDPYTQKMYDLMKTQPVYGEDNEYFYKHKGNVLIKTKKR